MSDWTDRTRKDIHISTYLRYKNSYAVSCQTGLQLGCFCALASLSEKKYCWCRQNCICDPLATSLKRQMLLESWIIQNWSSLWEAESDQEKIWMKSQKKP